MLQIAWGIITGALTGFIYWEGLKDFHDDYWNLTLVCTAYTWMAMGMMPIMISLS